MKKIIIKAHLSLLKTEANEIRRRILACRNRQRILRRKYIDLDVKIIALKNVLKNGRK